MAVDPKNVGSMMQQYPLKDLLAGLANGIIDSQRELDEVAIQSIKDLMRRTITNSNGETANLLELGFLPKFYQFDTATIKVSVTIKMAMEETTEKSVGGSVKIGGA